MAGPGYENQPAEVEDQTAGQGGIARSKREIDNTPQVQTYIEVKVQYYEKYAVVKRTHTDEGRMPRWNEILDFALVADNSQGFTMEELASSATMIIVSLFDKQTYLTQKEGFSISQEEHRFLGSVDIPLQSILSNPAKCDFNFRLNRPLFLPNYRVIGDEIYFMAQSEFAQVLENE